MMDVDNFIADCEARAMKDRLREPSQPQKYKGDELLHEAEAAKVRMAATPGNFNEQNINFSRQQATIVDENYIMIGGHVDEGVCSKIINHEYIDFALLLPRDRMVSEDDHRMELVSKGGSTYFVPVSDREVSGTINSFFKWEQAFRVYTNVYSRVYPERATELIQYNHLIHTASLSFTWDNVYRYDKEFRMHLSNFPQRNWGVILQQAWSVYLKDRIVKYDKYDKQGHAQGQGKKKEICKHFNKGKCNRGFRCSFDHRCLGCGKFGHGVHICRNKKGGDPQQNSTPVKTQQPTTSGNS